MLPADDVLLGLRVVTPWRLLVPVRMAGCVPFWDLGLKPLGGEETMPGSPAGQEIGGVLDELPSVGIYYLHRLWSMYVTAGW